LDFSNVAEAKPIQEWEISDDTSKGEIEYPTR
jgi:hypothetical protein